MSIKFTPFTPWVCATVHLFVHTKSATFCTVKTQKSRVSLQKHEKSAIFVPRLPRQFKDSFFRKPPKKNPVRLYENFFKIFGSFLAHFASRFPANSQNWQRGAWFFNAHHFTHASHKGRPPKFAWSPMLHAYLGREGWDFFEAKKSLTHLYFATASLKSAERGVIFKFKPCECTSIF